MKKLLIFISIILVLLLFKNTLAQNQLSLIDTNIYVGLPIDKFTNKIIKKYNLICVFSPPHSKADSKEYYSTINDNLLRCVFRSNQLFYIEYAIHVKNFSRFFNEFERMFGKAVKSNSQDWIFKNKFVFQKSYSNAITDIKKNIRKEKNSIQFWASQTNKKVKTEIIEIRQKMIKDFENRISEIIQILDDGVDMYNYKNIHYEFFNKNETIYLNYRLFKTPKQMELI